MYLKKVHKMVEDVEDQLVEQQMDIEDAKENFQGEMDIINKNLKANAISLGIIKDDSEKKNSGMPKLKDFDTDYLEEKEQYQKELQERYKDRDFAPISDIDNRGRAVQIKDTINRSFLKKK